MRLLQCVKLLLPVLLAGFAHAAIAQDEPPQFVREAVDAGLTMLDSDGDAAIETFINEAMVPFAERDRTDLVEYLHTLRNDVRGLRDHVAVEGEPDGVA